jgi:hypothetical protein
LRRPFVQYPEGDVVVVVVLLVLDFVSPSVFEASFEVSMEPSLLSEEVAGAVSFFSIVVVVLVVEWEAGGLIVTLGAGFPGTGTGTGTCCGGAWSWMTTGADVSMDAGRIAR